jgi:carbon storage regulator
MLVLSRMEDERIMIGPDIVITVVRIQGDKVRIGITAPPEVTILREGVKLDPAKTAARLVVPTDDVPAGFRHD